MPISPKELENRLRKIQLFLCDVDGVLTDASVYMSEGPVESKRFNIRDGLGIMCLRDQGLKVGWISRRPSTATAARAAELKIHFLHQARASKVEAVEEILKQTGLTWAEVCYVGDDIVDLGPMARAGLSVAVGDAVQEAKEAAHYVTSANGGHGAVREIAERILKAQDKWEAVLAYYRK